jgi:hypothetical protein
MAREVKQGDTGHCTVVVFVVAYWQTRGIYRLRGVVYDNGYFAGEQGESLPPRSFVRDEQEARATVEKRRKATLRALRKKVAKLTALGAKRIVIPLLKGDPRAAKNAR